MTTVAYKDGILAADSKETLNGILWDNLEKIRRTKCGKVIAFSGYVSKFNHLMTALDDGKDLSDIDLGEETALFMYDGKLWYISDTKGLEEMNVRQSYAMGSGYQIALGAMAAGASAVEAVRIACKYDCHSGLPVRSVRLF